ncbi:MAG: hypothetical protein R8M14_02240, partial [Ghiorsea sp.]
MAKEPCPAQSHDHKKICALAKHYNFDPDKLRNFFWLINVPSKLHLIIPVAQHLKVILSTAKQHPEILEQAPYISTWEEVIDFIESHLKEIKDKLSKHTWDYKKNKKHQLRQKTLSKNPAYSIIINKSVLNNKVLDNEVLNNEVLNKYYRLLQAHILFSHARLMELHTNLETYNQNANDDFNKKVPHSAIDECCRYIRVLGDSKVAAFQTLVDDRTSRNLLTLSTPVFA